MKNAAELLDEWDMPANELLAYVAKRLGSFDLARYEMQQALSEGEIVAMDWSVRGADDSKQRELPAEFWRSVKLRFVKDNPHEIFIELYDGRRHSLFLRRREVEKRWPTSNNQPVSAADERPPWPSKSAAGAPSRHDWEEILANAAVYMYVNSVPKSLAELCRAVEKSYRGEPPGKTQLENHLDPLYQKFKRADGK
jgi:hypothetical protein